jgi:hypothetical protein
MLTGIKAMEVLGGRGRGGDGPVRCSCSPHKSGAEAACGSGSPKGLPDAVGAEWEIVAGGSRTSRIARFIRRCK